MCIIIPFIISLKCSFPEYLLLSQQHNAVVELSIHINAHLSCQYEIHTVAFIALPHYDFFLLELNECESLSQHFDHFFLERLEEWHSVPQKHQQVLFLLLITNIRVFLGYLLYLVSVVLFQFNELLQFLSLLKVIFEHIRLLRVERLESERIRIIQTIILFLPFLFSHLPHFVFEVLVHLLSFRWLVGACDSWILHMLRLKVRFESPALMTHIAVYLQNGLIHGHLLIIVMKQ